MDCYIKTIQRKEGFDNRLPFKFDPRLWATKLPDITPPDLSCDDEFDDFKVYFDKNNLYPQFNLWGFSETIEFLKLTAEDNSISTITNKDIAANIGHTQFDDLSFKVFGNYLCCIFEFAIGQAGGLGIWDAKIKEWCFWFSDDLFCLSELTFSEDQDVFSGKCSFSYPMSPFGGTVDFEINSKRELKSKSYKYIDVEGKEVIGIGKFFDKET